MNTSVLTLGLKKRPKKKKEKMSETNSGSVAKVREAYASLTKGNGNKLPTNFSEVFATVGKEMAPPQKDPITDSLITEEHLALLETSGDNKISGEFLKKKMDGFLKIMTEIQGKVDSKELEFKDGKLEVSKVMQEFKDALKEKDATNLQFADAVSILSNTQKGEPPPISLVEGFNYMLGAIGVDLAGYSVNSVEKPENKNYINVTLANAATGTKYEFTFPQTNTQGLVKALIETGDNSLRPLKMVKSFGTLKDMLTELDKMVVEKKEKEAQKQKEANEKKEKEIKTVNALFDSAPTDTNPPARIIDKPSSFLDTLFATQEIIKQKGGPDFGSGTDWYMRKNGDNIYLVKYPSDGGEVTDAYKIETSLDGGNRTIDDVQKITNIQQESANMGGFPASYLREKVMKAYETDAKVRPLDWSDIGGATEGNYTYKNLSHPPTGNQFVMALWDKSDISDLGSDNLYGYVVVDKLTGIARVWDHDTVGQDDPVGRQFHLPTSTPPAFVAQ